MILKQTYSKEWISNFLIREKHDNINPELLEKMIYAFILLEKLAENNLNFIFKGGTALVLLLNETSRFSIDIDIITNEQQNYLENNLNKVIEKEPFTNYSLDNRRSFINKIPKAHYKFSYISVLNNKEKTILLDVLFSENPYPEIKEFLISTPWLNTTEPYLTVKLPTIEAILGDKLTAFAPNTIGIPYSKDKYLQIIKQLFDISNLIDSSNDLKTVFNSFLNTSKNEIQYHSLEINYEDVLIDIFNTSLLITKRENNKNEPDKTNFNELKLGLNSFKDYLIKNTFYIEQAIESCAKIAWFTELLKQNRFNEFALFSEKINTTDFIIENTEYNFINRLKKTNKPAFYYWYKCLEMKELLRGRD